MSWPPMSSTVRAEEKLIPCPQGMGPNLGDYLVGKAGNSGMPAVSGGHHFVPLFPCNQPGRSLHQGVLRNFEAYLRIKSGEERFGLISADIIDIEGDKYILSITNDITERKRVEEELYRREQFLNVYDSIQDPL